MLRRTVLACALAAVGLCGCGPAGPPPNAKTLKFETTGKSGKLVGSLRAASPGTAGIATKGFEVAVPGSVELKAGPSEYTLVIDGMPKDVTLKLSVDGKELLRGQDIIWEDDKGPRLTFNVK